MRILTTANPQEATGPTRPRATRAAGADPGARGRAAEGVVRG